MPFNEVHLPLVNFLPVANPEDIFEVDIGDVNPAFDDSHDLHTSSCRSSSCTDMDDDNEEHEYFDALATLDDLVWPAELFYNPQTLGNCRQHERGRRKHQKSKGPGGHNQHANEETSDTGIGEQGNVWKQRGEEEMATSALCGRGEGSERGTASGPRFATPVPSSLAASLAPSSPALRSAVPGPASPALHPGLAKPGPCFWGWVDGGRPWRRREWGPGAIPWKAGGSA